MSVGQRIKDARKRKRWSQVRAGEELGVSRTTVDNWEKDKHHPTDKQVPKLIKLLELPSSAFNKFGAGGVGPVADPLNGDVLIPLIRWEELVLMEAGKISVAKLRRPRFVSMPPLTPEHWIALEVRDDSMAPTFNVGDRFLIDPDRTPKDGDWVVARILAAKSPNDYVLRTYRIRRDAYDLVAEKGGYNTVSVHSDKGDARISGVVVEHHKRLHR